MAQRATGRKIATITRAQEAVALRLAGATFEQIGAALKTSRQRAHQLVTGHIEESRRALTEDCEMLRTIECARLDAMTSRLWPKIEQGEIAAMDSMLRIMARRAKLLGLDAPARIAPTNPAGDRPYGGYSDAELVDLVRKIAEQHADADPE